MKAHWESLEGWHKPGNSVSLYAWGAGGGAGGGGSLSRRRRKDIWYPSEICTYVTRRHCHVGHVVHI